ncbi:adhesin [Streptomyces sp. NBC_01353]|uniref:adhesin n=1 Tax=Streptomyces sp. NBC_01353 TaxID=2903835 RepID=UPI002E33F206|nr:adhesin [Streptomyces sp. NBC_01353]
MACEKCGGVGRGPLPGMGCRQCVGIRIKRRGPGRAVALAAVAAVSCLAVVVSLAGAEDPPPAAAEGDPPIRTVPTRNGPTEFPGAPAPSTSSPSGEPPTTTAPPPSSSSHPSPPHYEVWAGPGCEGGGYTESGRFADGFEGWYTVRTGGFRGGGCDGRFSALPMSGSATRDHDNSATWTWEVGPAYRTCDLAVHVPSPPRPQDAAGDPSVYQLLAHGTPYATFTVDQVDHPGTLVPTGHHPLRTPTFTVRLLDRGQDWGTPTREQAHHAAGQMRLTCRQA